VNSASGWTAGTDLQWYKAEFEARENNEPYVGDEQRDMEATLFGEYNRQLTSALDVFAGARLTHLQSTNAMYVLPNARLHYKLGDRMHVRAAYSKNLQTVYELTVDNRFGREIETLALSDPDENYPVLTSDKYMLGAGYGTGPFGFDVELFYKKTDGLTQITAVMPDPGHNHQHGGGQQETFYRLYSGDGYARGVDISVLYAKGKFDGAVFYTLSRIAERYERLFKGEYYSPEEDRRHQLKVSGRYDIGPFEISSLVTYKSEAPYLSFIRLEGRGGLQDVDRESVVRYLPPYFSIDLGIDYAFRLFRQPAQIGISLINATNHKNIDDVQHLGRVSRDFGEGDFYITQQTELLGRTGNVRFRIVF
jgi:hypothetical protein